jgi:hypothetical protein
VTPAQPASNSTAMASGRPLALEMMELMGATPVKCSVRDVRLPSQYPFLTLVEEAQRAM